MRIPEEDLELLRLVVITLVKQAGGTLTLSVRAVEEASEVPLGVLCKRSGDELQLELMTVEDLLKLTCDDDDDPVIH